MSQKNIPFFYTDTVYNNYFNPYLIRLDSSELKVSDLRIRLWFSNGFSRTNVITSVSLSKENGIWSAFSYTLSKQAFTNDSSFKIVKDTIKQIDLDSMYKLLSKDDLLTQNSTSLGRIIDQRQQNVVWTDGGPTVYLIEIITPQKRWALRYPCPKYFLDKYKIIELEKPLRIVTNLLNLIHRSPC